MPTQDERITRLEVQQEQLFGQINAMREDISDIKAKVTELSDNERKRSGFVLGIVFTVSTVWALIGGIWTFFRHKFGA